ncbi:bromodomain-containing protein DDB_G0270170 isoform X2 [Drosophila novamexicana]|uniref:bromodomain-containing protein DDB_G0270170 isoform X2 n=1 Tax=Drosophila novamexicana TaxID=47314 RepID=UPI0011E5CC11|nr:bromodomain-containing protein DDB_G0270170 isoform X2 [Drosophila novamexicana]
MSTTVEQTSSEAHTAGNLTATATAATTTATVAAVTAAAATATAAAPTPITEIEQLQQALLERQTQLYALETACLRETERQVELEDSVIAWQDKYDRLYESHKRVQKVNQSLEDKMLKLVDRNTNERAQLTSDVATLSVRLAQANFNIAKLQREIERYKADISLAIQLLQCKPDSFVPQKVSSLPIDIQSKVSAYMRLETNSHSDSECSNSGVGVATTASYKVLPVSDSPPPAPCPFPPTAMVYSMRGLDAANGNSANAQTAPANNNNNNNSNNSNNNSRGSSTKDTINNNNISNNNNKHSSSQTLNGQPKTNSNNNNNNNADPDMISPTVMAKFLEDELKLNDVKHCDTCQCSKQDLTVLADIARSYSVATQTPHSLATAGASTLNEPLTQLCLRCHSNLNSPSRTNSPYLMKLVKSSDSVISETKSSVSDLNDMDKLFTLPKKDDLMVNPILGHHRLCERTSLPASANTLMYPTTHLGAYAGAEKYLLETSNPGQLRQGTAAYQRRFLDGGGTALQLLNKYEATATTAAAATTAAEELEDEVSKPLLAAISQPNLLEAEQPPVVQLTKPEDVCEPQPAKPIAVVGAGVGAVVGVTAAPASCPLKSNNSGSVQSLWSNKTSSCEGAKMFETFNRNLIKTIKAENPKYRGPRLCAMRIQQNGQSNILLDNLESIETHVPVIYKRRERLLDEELNDGKDIITSKESNATAVVEVWQASAMPHENVALQPVLEPQVELKETEKSVQLDSSNMPTAVSSVAAGTTEVVAGSGVPIGPGVITAAAAVAAAAVCSPKHSANSSSLSDAIDYQESVLLRRQQLNRVAEWVQHNTQQLEQRALQQPALPTDSNSGTERQSSYSTLDRMDSISIEKLSMDSGYKTTPQQLTNGYADAGKSTEDSLSPKTDITSNSLPEAVMSNSQPGAVSAAVVTKKAELCTTYYRRTTRSGLPVAYTTTTTTMTAVATAADSQGCSSAGSPSLLCPEQPTCDILNYKYYPNDTDKTRSVQAELHTTTQHVDIAQMEYNVKQFLLKQNEWSMRAEAAAPGAAGASAPRLLRHTRLLGPGVGERVRMATPGGAVAAAPSVLAPHRTETNL